MWRYIWASQSAPRFRLASPDCQFSLHHGSQSPVPYCTFHMLYLENDQSLSSSRSMSAILKTASNGFGTPTCKMMRGWKTGLTSRKLAHHRHQLHQSFSKSTHEALTLVGITVKRLRDQILVKFCSHCRMSTCGYG